MDAKTNILRNEKLNSDFVRKNIDKTGEFIYVSSVTWTKGELKKGVTNCGIGNMQRKGSKTTRKKQNVWIKINKPQIYLFFFK